MRHILLQPKHLLLLFLPLGLIFLPYSYRLSAASAANEIVQIWETTPDQTKLLEPQPDGMFVTDDGVELPTIDVDESVTYQQMDGFGASLTDSSAWLISHTLDSSQRDRLLNDLFSPTTGIGLTFLRQPMGASDFTASGNYSYDDMPAGQTDPTLAHFSIDHDRAELIPLLKQIKTINPALKLMASPWSPPGWMKTSDSMIGGTLNADSWWSIYELNVYAASDLPLSRTNWVATAFSSPTICCYGDTPPKAIDGDGGTRWSSGVGQAPNNQWFQIDMGTPQTFDRIVMDAGSSGQDYPRAYQVYVSNDGTNWGRLRHQRHRQSTYDHHDDFLCHPDCALFPDRTDWLRQQRPRSAG